MPLPLILGAGAVGFVVNRLMAADSNNARASRMTTRALNQMGETQRKLAIQQETTAKSLLKLANRKRGVVKSSIEPFLNIYQQIMQLDMDEVDPEQKGRWNKLINQGVPTMKHMITVSGAAMSDKELIVNMLFSFKHGGIIGSIVKDSEIEVQLARARKRQAAAISEKMQNEAAVLEGIATEAEAHAGLLAKLNVFFLKSISHSADIIQRNGTNRASYSRDDRAALMTCINLAGAVYDILQTPLFDEDGNIHQEIEKTLAMGEQYLVMLQKG